MYHTECLTSFIQSAADIARCPCCRANIPYRIQNDNVILESLYETWQFDIDCYSDKSYEEESEEEDEEEESEEEDSEKEESEEEDSEEEESEEEESEEEDSEEEESEEEDIQRGRRHKIRKILDRRGS